MELEIRRDTFSEKTTLGRLVNIICDAPVFVCYTLEDALRGFGVKIPGGTCMAAGRYKVNVSYSPTFKREMVIIYNCADGYTLKGGGISFTGLRMHGGNSHEDTSGCVCVAKHRLSDVWIQGTHEAEVLALVKTALNRGEDVWLEVINEVAHET